MSIRAASAPINWGIMEHVDFRLTIPMIGCWMRSRRQDTPAPSLVLTDFSLPIRPCFAVNSQKRSLTLCSAFIDVELGNPSAHEGGLAEVSRSAKLISEADAKLLVLSDKITPARNATAGRRNDANQISWSEEEWKAAAKAIGEVIAVCKAAGLRVAFHHHAGSHVETPEEVDRLFSLFPANELGLCLDTGHYIYGGGDAVAFLERQVSRVWCVHLKDVYEAKANEARHAKMNFHAAVKHGIFAPLGKGSVDFPRVIHF